MFYVNVFLWMKKFKCLSLLKNSTITSKSQDIQDMILIIVLLPESLGSLLTVHHRSQYVLAHFQRLLRRIAAHCSCFLPHLRSRGFLQSSRWFCVWFWYIAQHPKCQCIATASVALWTLEPGNHVDCHCGLSHIRDTRWLLEEEVSTTTFFFAF